jgi:hypothetical protein
MGLQKVLMTATPANAGVYNLLKLLDPNFRRDDSKRRFWTFYEPINIGDCKDRTLLILQFARFKYNTIFPIFL